MSLLTTTQAILISNVPMIRFGLNALISQYFPEYQLYCFRTQDELDQTMLNTASVVIADIPCNYTEPRGNLEDYYSLIHQYRHVHWVFLTSRVHYSLAVELLMGPESTLLSDMESVEGVVNAIRAGRQRAERISQKLLLSGPEGNSDADEKMAGLTLSERRVMRLLGKGWGINQIASVLKKSNKTISAQKNSAMRRLSLRSNADMYAWLSSAQGMKELNTMSITGEFDEWNRLQPEHELRSSKIAS